MQPDHPTTVMATLWKIFIIKKVFICVWILCQVFGGFGEKSCVKVRVDSHCVLYVVVCISPRCYILLLSTIILNEPKIP